MATSEYPKDIVRTFTRPDAPTSEGQSYVCADGSVWHEKMFTGFEGTCERWGQKAGNQIHEL